MASKRSRESFEADVRKQESPYVFYGTALPPLDERARDDGTYVPIWKQDVTDDRGRKRLHGAFTGGFSAGYFNTVGSKEGWTPSTFVSSRQNRAKDKKDTTVQARPEDFMDEEDLREAEESRHISTTNEFAGFGTEDDSKRRDAFTDLFKPAVDSMGEKLLNRMGWKQGQGIGPKIKRRAYSDDEHAETHVFAPEDVQMISFAKKDDNKGLGFEGESGQSKTIIKPSSSTSRPLEKPDGLDGSDDDGTHPNFMFPRNTAKPKKSSRGAFGIGVLNDTGSDDEDPYAIGPNIAYNKTIGGDKKTKKQKSGVAVGNANPLLRTKPVFISKKLSSIQHALRKCHDGRLPLSGFVLADVLDGFASIALSDDQYKPPQVSEGWKPSRIAADEAANPNQATTYQSTSDAAKSSQHTSHSRASALGETLLPGKSVFDFLSPAAREKLVKATGRQNLPPALGEKVSGTETTTDKEHVRQAQLPSLDASTALQALQRAQSGGFMPYAEDPAKRIRYKIFLEVSAGLKGQDELSLRPLGPQLTGEDNVNELYEFARAAEVFKPMSAAIASRFTSSTASQTQSQNGSGGDAANLLSKPQAKPANPAEEAAKMGMFGHLTRTTVNFYPTKLLCKRFGVSMPTHIGGTADAQGKAGVAEMDPSTVMHSAAKFQSAGFITQGEDHHEQDEVNARTNTSDEHPTTEPVSQAGPSNASAVLDPDRNDALEQERPGAAVFKVIFGSDDEEDEEEED